MRIQNVVRFFTFVVLALPPLVGQTRAFEVALIRPQLWTNEGQVAVYVRGNTLYGEHADLLHTD